MGDTTGDLKKELEKRLTTLKTLRDEVRVRMHLANMDLKEQWKKLEPHIEEVEKKAGELTDASKSALSEAVKRLEKFRESLR
jgi:hypothetical protein